MVKKGKYAVEKKSADNRQDYKVTEFMHRILSSEQVIYLYSENRRILHEKHCRRAREIPDEELRSLKEYDPAMEQCPECAAAAYIRIGAKDPEDMERYLSLFDRIGMPVKAARKMYLNKQMRTRIRRDTIIVWHKEDMWKIRALSRKGRVQLFHNNYIVGKDGRREFTGNFHIQNEHCRDTNISYALNIIGNYDFKPEEAELHCNAMCAS